MPTVTRREFITASTGLAALSSASDLPATPSESSKPWHASVRRCGQLNLNARDPLTLDADAWMDYWASLKVNAVTINAGGIMAFYPTQIRYHHRSEFLGSRDLFGDIVTAARKRGIRIIARINPNTAYQEALDAHPEWFQRNLDGSLRTGDYLGLYETCMFSTYFTEQMPAIFREVNQRYQPDATYTPGWPGAASLDTCYCSTCQRLYLEQIGGVPGHADPGSVVYRKYYELYMERIAEIWKHWEQIAKEKNSKAVYFGNLGDGLRTVKDLKRLTEPIAWFNADHQGRSGDSPIWACAEQGRVAQCVMNGRTISCDIAAFANTVQWCRHATKPAAETNLWMAQVTASGMVPWFHWQGGAPLDNRWRETGRAFFEWLAANEAHFRNRRSLANIAVLYPQSTIAFYRSDGVRQRPLKGQLIPAEVDYRTLNGMLIDPVDYLEGLYYALLQGRFAFDFVHQGNLTPENLKPYRVLLLPNAAYLRDSECEAIRQYAAGGGSVLATFETSRYSEWGEPRANFGLADLFGVNVAGDVVGPAENAYMQIRRSHPILDDFQGTQILPGPEFRVPVNSLPPESLALSVIPNYSPHPPEMDYPRHLDTSEPAAVFRQNGNCRMVYFPGDIERTGWRSGNPDFSRLIANSIHWLLGDDPPTLTVEGAGIMEMFAWETEPGLALHILNYTNPQMTRSLIHEVYPIGPLQVKLQAPTGKKFRNARALRSERRLPFKMEGETIDFEVPLVKDYEVVVLT